jgi:hypothetical protein
VQNCVHKSVTKRGLKSSDPRARVWRGSGAGFGPYPQLVAFPVEANEQTLLTCLSYPTALDRSVTEPVVSDIPALLYLGPLDNETPVGWGREVAKGLSRSTVMEWANQGHVAAAKDPKYCVGDIAAAFLADPASAPDLDCAQSEEYKLQFVLE